LDTYSIDLCSSPRSITHYYIQTLVDAATALILSNQSTSHHELPPASITPLFTYNYLINCLFPMANISAAR